MLITLFIISWFVSGFLASLYICYTGEHKYYMSNGIYVIDIFKSIGGSVFGYFVVFIVLVIWIVFFILELYDKYGESFSKFLDKKVYPKN